MGNLRCQILQLCQSLWVDGVSWQATGDAERTKRIALRIDDRGSNEKPDQAHPDERVGAKSIILLCIQ